MKEIVLPLTTEMDNPQSLALVLGSAVAETDPQLEYGLLKLMRRDIRIWLFPSEEAREGVHLVSLLRDGPVMHFERSDFLKRMEEELDGRGKERD